MARSTNRARSRRSHLGRPPGASSEITRARILRAARACFARTGYAATTNKDIADEAGVTTAAIYLYFESKIALYQATVRAAYAELLPHFRAAVAREGGSARDGLRAILAASTGLHANDPSLAAFFAALPVEMRRHAELARTITEEGAEVVELFTGIVGSGVRAGEISATVAPHVLSLFIACTMGLSLYITAIEDSQFAGIIDAFNGLIDGTLFRQRSSSATTKASTSTSILRRRTRTR
jgi:AcrR family transcriptional regulator